MTDTRDGATPVFYLVFSSSMGRVLRSGQCLLRDLPLQASNTMAADEAVSETTVRFDADKTYVLKGAPTPRPPHPATIDKTSISADGSDAATVSNVPNPTNVAVVSISSGSQRMTATDGTVVLTTSMPDTYTIMLDSFPYLPIRFQVVAS